MTSLLRSGGRRTCFLRLAPGHCADDHERFGAGNDFGRQRRLGRRVRKILFAGVIPNERSPAECVGIPDRSAQDREKQFNCIEQRSKRDRSVLGGADLELNVIIDPGQVPKMKWEDNADHCYYDYARTWTSTDSTAGRSRTIGFQVSPLSADA